MTPRKLGRFVAQNIGRNRKNFIFAGVGIVVGISSFIFFTALGSGIKHVVSTEIFPVEANRTTVIPRKAGFSGPGEIKPIDDAAVRAMEALPGVAAVYPRMRLAVPATMSLVGAHFPEEELARLARLPGVTPDIVASVKRLDLWLEIMADGIDPRLVKDEVQFGTFAEPKARRTGSLPALQAAGRDLQRQFRRNAPPAAHQRDHHPLRSFDAARGQ